MKKFTAVLLCFILVFSLAGCSSKDDQKSIIIYDGNFSEMKLIHQMVKLLVEDKTDVTVTIKDEMTAVNSYNELLKGTCDLMNSYDGTLLTTYLKLDTTDVPKDQTLYDYANKIATEDKKVHLLDKLGINNTYAIAVTQTVADKYNLNTISDLIPVANELVFGAEHEFFSEEGSMKFTPFIEFYGLNFKDSKPVDLNLKYTAIENGNFDVTEVYATDGLNKKAQLKVLEDDQSFFPEYNGALLVRNDLFERFKDVAPDLEEVLNQLGGIFTNEIMVDLTYQVDVDGKSVEEVAKAFLQEKGLIG